MLDIRFVVEHPKEIKDNLKKRGKTQHIWIVDELVSDYKNFTKLKKEIDDIRQKRNTLSRDINQQKKQKKDTAKLLKQAAAIPGKLNTAEKKMSLLREEIQKKIIQLPNMLHASVPQGKDEKNNKEIRKVGVPKKTAFKILNHAELTEKLCIADFEAGRKVAGQGFNYISGELAQLDAALLRYGVDFLLKKGFTLVVPPMMLNKKTLGGVVNLSDFEEVIYKIEGEDLYMIGTAEHPLVAMMMGKTLNKKNLPIKICAVTPCFRKEIGGHGVDTKGLFRMHQFNKVEQVMFSSPKDSFKHLEEMQKLSEAFFKSLGIPFRVIEICSGDIGDKGAKQYDIEGWFPRQQAYKEVTSASNCTDYQSRKLNIRYTDGKEKGFVHILNNTMVASSRALVAILENHQQRDGSIAIPKPLQKYTGFTKIRGKKR